jgi:hypothetical protein
LPNSNDEDIAEQIYTKKYFDELTEFAIERDEEYISEFARSYFENPRAGYAFHSLGSVFEEIDIFIGIGSPMASASPWEYFSNVKSLATFSKKITQLTGISGSFRAVRDQEDTDSGPQPRSKENAQKDCQPRIKF